MKCDHPLWAFALSLGTLTHGGAFGIKRLSRGGESMVESYIFSALHWEILRCCGIVVFGKFSCGTYVIVVLNSDIVVFLNMRIFFVIALAIFSMAKVVEFFDFSFRGYGVQYTPSRSNRSSNLNFWACVYFHYKTGFDSMISCPVAVVEKFRFSAKQYSHGNLLCGWRTSLNPSAEIFIKAAEILWCKFSTAPLHGTIYYYYDDDDDYYYY